MKFVADIEALFLTVDSQSRSSVVKPWQRCLSTFLDVWGSNPYEVRVFSQIKNFLSYNPKIIAPIACCSRAIHPRAIHPSCFFNLSSPSMIVAIIDFSNLSDFYCYSVKICVRDVIYSAFRSSA